MIVQSILGPRGLAIVADVGFVLACVAFLWGAIKLAYQRTQGQAMPRNLFTKALDVGVEAFNIVWGTINRAVKLDTGRGLFLPTQPSDGAPVLARAELEARLAETERSRDALMRAIEESSSHAIRLPPNPEKPCDFVDSFRPRGRDGARYGSPRRVKVGAVRAERRSVPRRQPDFIVDTRCVRA